MREFAQPPADIAFSRDDARSMLPLMVACLSAFVCLLLSFSLSLSQHVGDAAHASSANVQLEVPLAIASDKQEMQRIMRAVRATAGVQSAKVIDHAAMQQMLAPWLGGGLMLGALEMPVLIDVVTSAAVEEDSGALERLKAALMNVRSEMTLRSKSPWQRDIVRASRVIHVCLLGFAALLTACLMAMVVLLSRTGLKLHFKTVSVLHLFGATDDYILRQFQWNILGLVARGAIIGVALAALIYWALSGILNVGENPLLPALAIAVPHYMLWVLLPVFVCALSVIAARLSVQHMLSTMH